MAEFHDVDSIIDGNIDTTHHALVIAKEEDGEAAHAIYGNKEGTLLKAVDYIESRDLVHDPQRKGHSNRRECCTPSKATTIGFLDEEQSKNWKSADLGAQQSLDGPGRRSWGDPLYIHSTQA